MCSAFYKGDRVLFYFVKMLAQHHMTESAKCERQPHTIPVQNQRETCEMYHSVRDA